MKSIRKTNVVVDTTSRISEWITRFTIGGLNTLGFLKLDSSWVWGSETGYAF